ncbi:hydrophobic protein [Streptomyces olivoreticuli]
MIVWIALLLPILILFGFGFVAHLLWIAAAVVLIIWILGFGRHSRSHGGLVGRNRHRRHGRAHR